MRVVGTAGHVDHGKSTLVTALTGINPDRLKEEREREMTIDLGFAWLRLPDGEQVGIVSLRDALAYAEKINLDLVEVAPMAAPPVCKVMHYGKYRYEQEQKAKEAFKQDLQVAVKNLTTANEQLRHAAAFREEVELIASKVTKEVVHGVTSIPSLAGQGTRVATAIQSGQVGQILRSVPAPARPQVTVLAQTAFTAGLNLILLVAAIIAFCAGAVALLTIRSRDFVAHQSAH